VFPPKVQECSRGTMEESTRADSIDSVCEGGAVCASIAPTHVEHEERRSGERARTHAHDPCVQKRKGCTRKCEYLAVPPLEVHPGGGAVVVI
jgi:hypothetical protein